MNIGKFDMGVLFILSLAVVLISFTGPVFGLTDADATNESDIPNLTVGQDSFDIAGDFPEEPGNPSGGTLNYTLYPLSSDRTDPVGQGLNREFITGSYQNTNGVELLIQNAQDNGTANIKVYDYTGVGQVVSENISAQEGDNVRIENKTLGIVVDVDVTNVDNNLYGNGTRTAEMDYNVEETPSDSGVFRNLPIVGGIVSGAGALASIVGWIGSIIFYYALTAAEAIINAVVMLFDVTSYLISMVAWLFGTYLQVVDGAPGWASVIVALPGVLFAAILSKFVAVGISLLPTT